MCLPKRAWTTACNANSVRPFETPGGEHPIFFDIAGIDRFLANHSTIFEIAFWSSLTLGALVTLTFVYIALARITFHLKRRHRLKVEAIWSPVFRAISAGASTGPPKAQRGDGALVLEIWIENRSVSSGQQADALDAAARTIGLDDTICKILTPHAFALGERPVWLQILAITAAQWLPSPDVLARLWRTLESRNRFLVLNACTTLVRLQAEDFEKAIIKTLFRFPDQVPAMTTQVGAAGGAAILHVLQPFLGRLPAYTLANFIALAERSDDKTLLPLIEDKLDSCRDDEEAGALLRAIGNLGTTEQRPTVIPFLTHQTAFLRIQAVKALGRIGDESDIARLVPLLTDKNWWLRQRAAEAVFNLCDQDPEFLEALIAAQDDPFAVDILRHVIAEKGWCLT
jgi:hypothetical protein